MIAAAERELSRTFGGDLRLTGGHTAGGGTGRALVFRLNVESAVVSPKSVILKYANVDDENPWAPDDPDGRAHTIFNEWAALHFLTDLADSSDSELAAPRFYCGDREVGAIIMSDLGDTGNVLNALTGVDPTAAEEAVFGWARAVGAFHASSVGRRDQFAAIRKHLGPITDDTPPQNYGVAFAEMCKKVGVQVSADAEAEVEGLASISIDRGPFDALTPGDTCLDNNMRTPSGWKLLDFEFARFRNALLDVSYLRSLLPTCWGVGRIPMGLIQQAEALYRETLEPACPSAADSTLFDRSLVEACAFWVVDPFVKWLMPKALDEDWEWGFVTVRQRIITRFDVFSDMTRELSHMTALGNASAELAERLKALWPEVAEVPYYPAFR